MLHPEPSVHPQSVEDASAPARAPSSRAEFLDFFFKPAVESGAPGDCGNLKQALAQAEAEKIADKVVSGADVLRDPLSGHWVDSFLHSDDPNTLPFPMEAIGRGQFTANVVSVSGSGLPVLSNIRVSPDYEPTPWPIPMPNVPVANPTPQAHHSSMLCPYYLSTREQDTADERSPSAKNSSVSPQSAASGASASSQQKTPLGNKKTDTPMRRFASGRKKAMTEGHDSLQPVIVSELPNGHGVTIVGTRLPNGEIATRVKYDRNLMLALSHSPFSLSQPENYPQIVREMDEIIPPFPRRYIPREFL